jgi:serine/threonine-protein kinase Chk1
MEVSLHSHIGQHPNIIEWFATGEDDIWKWIAMEFAEGGDLFDKIEADVGVSEDIAHFYFTQLVSGISYMHSKGVGHRDLKPENILLSENGNLKIADFGLATLFEYNGVRKLSTTLCGSPPYIAPEVISCTKGSDTRRAAKGSGYAADMVDIWSCGVILFVLLVGNTPWDEPTAASWEFEEYCRGNGKSSDELWQKVPPSALSLLRGMMNIDTTKRFTFDHIRRHPWYTRKNSLLTADGMMSDPLHLATTMLENLRIDFTQQPTASQHSTNSQSAMDIDKSDPWAVKFASTQPEAPANDIIFDWERPPRLTAYSAHGSSQPTSMNDTAICAITNGREAHPFDVLAEEPTMSQFTVTPQLPLSLTQHARRFRDIVPNYSLTRFFSHVSPSLLLSMLNSALHQLNVPVPVVPTPTGGEHAGWIKVKTVDGRNCGLSGDIVVDKYALGEAELLEVRFVKVKGDPLEWRRFFKKVVVLCKDGVYIPEE